MTWQHIVTRSRTLILFCIASALLADWLFYNQQIGFTPGLFALFLTLLILVRGGKRVTSPIAWLGLAVIGLSIAWMAQPGPLVFLMLGCGTAALAVSIRDGWSRDFTDWILRGLMFAVRGFIQWAVELNTFLRIRRRRAGESRPSSIPRIARNWLLPIAGSLVFFGLFNAANPVLSLWTSDFTDALDRALKSIHINLERVFFWMFFAYGCWMLLRVRTKIHPTHRSDEAQAAPGSLFSSPLLIRCFAMFNAVFAIQTLMDITYLWGGKALPDGMTYASYAHRGSYPLVVTVLLAALFVLIAFRPAPPTRERATVRRLVLLWLAQNVFLVISSAWRLRMYTEAYSLTRLRVAAGIWLLLVALGLAWIGVRILAGRTNRWLVNINFATMIVVLYMCCFVNFSSMIAWYNVRHCREAGGSGYFLDTNYMLALGEESYPPMLWLDHHCLEAPSVPRFAQVREVLRNRVAWETSYWRGYTYRNMKLSVEMAADNLPSSYSAAR